MKEKIFDKENDCHLKNRHADPLAELEHIHVKMHNGKSYSFEQSLMCDLINEIKRLREFEWMYKELQK